MTEICKSQLSDRDPKTPDGRIVKPSVGGPAYTYVNQPIIDGSFEFDSSYVSFGNSPLGLSAAKPNMNINKFGSALILAL